MVLRPGGVTLEELRAILGDVRVLNSSASEAAKRSPGTRYRHYAPRARVLLVEQGMVEAVLGGLSGKRVGVLVWGPHPSLPSPVRKDGRGDGSEGPEVIVIQMPRSLRDYARRLFAALRELDAQGVEVIVVEKLEERGLGRAIMDRLRRASGSEGEA